MAGNTDLSTADYLIKYMYKDGLDENALTSSNALLAYVERDYDFTSTKGKVIAAPGTNAQAGSVTNANSYAARAGTTGLNFTVPVRRMFAYGALSSDLVRITEAGSDESQFAKALGLDIDTATEAFGQEINQRLYGAALGVRAKVHASTAISATLLTLENPEDANFFSIDMRVSALNGSDDTLRDTGDYVTLVDVNPVTGVLTADGNWSGISGITTGDKLIRWGTRTASLDGLAGWNPETAALSASFLGVNQTVNRATRAGMYADVSGFAVRQAFIKASAISENLLGRHAAASSPWFMNPSDVAEVKMSVEAVKVVETSLKTKYNVGLDTIEVLGCRIISDRHCPVGHAFQVPNGALTLGTAGKQPKIDDQDGRRLNYDRQNGQLEFIMAMDGNAYSDCVNRLSHIKLPARTPL